MKLDWLTTDPELRKLYESVFRKTDSLEIIRSLAGRYLSHPSQLQRLDTVFRWPKAVGLLINTVDGSRVRFRTVWAALFEAVGKVLRVDLLEPVFELYDSAEYRYSLNLYYRPPIDEKLIALFETTLIEIAVLDREAGLRFLRASDEFLLVDLYKDFGADPSVLELFLTYLRRSVLKGPTPEDPVVYGQFLLGETTYRLVEYFDGPGPAFFDFFNSYLAAGLDRNTQDREALETLTAVLHSRCIVPMKKRDQGRPLLVRLSILPLATRAEDLATALAFLKLFPYVTREPQRLLWGLLIKAGPTKVPSLITFFTSPGFREFYHYYRSRQAAILEFLLDRILELLEGQEFEKLPATIMPVVMKLMLGSRMDIPFLRSRTEFADWLEEHSRSERLKALFARCYFYEFILLAAGQVHRRSFLRLKRWADRFHKAFDTLLSDLPTLSTKAKKLSAYKKIRRLGRDELWKIPLTRFKGREKTVGKVRAWAEQMDYEDEALAGYEALDSKYFWLYSEAIIDAFKNSPLRSKVVAGDRSAGAEPFDPRFWSRLSFERALPFLIPLVTPLVGAVPIVKSAMHPRSAYTDGQQIYLPHFEDDFPDYPEANFTNRNLTLFAGLALHEAGHLLAGSFSFDFGLLLRQVEFPSVLKDLFNAFEDVRIERVVKDLSRHPQTVTIIDSMNLFRVGTIDPDRVSILDAINLCLQIRTEGFWGDLIVESPQWAARWQEALDLGLVCTPFDSLSDLAAHFTARFKAINVGDPVETFLTCFELYQIERNWPPVIIQAGGGIGRGAPGDGSGPSHQGGGHSIQTLEELKQLAAKPKPTPQPGHPVLSLAGPAGTPQGRPRLGEKHLSVPRFDQATGSLTKMSLVKETIITEVVPTFLAAMTKYRRVEENVARNLWQVLENNRAHTEEWSSLEGEVDLEKLIEIFSDRKNSWDHRFLSFEDETRKSLAALIAFDCSGSTGTKIRFTPKANPGTQEWVLETMAEAATYKPGDQELRVIDVEKQFALIFHRALELLTGQVEVYGYQSYGTTTIFVPQPVEALTSLKPDNANRDGTVIRYLAEKLKSRNAELKYFFIITDGIPMDLGYHDEVALMDTLLALRECRKAGLKVIYLNIDMNPAPYFSRIAKEVVFARHFSNPSQILGAIPELINKIVRDVV